MEDLFRSYWWLIFPIMGFAFAGFGMVMGLAMQRDRMKLLRTYAEKGQTPPPELAGSIDPYGAGYDDYGPGPGYYGPGPGYYGYGRPDRYARRAWRREMRWRAWGPLWGVRRSFFFLAVFIAFAVSAGWSNGHVPGWMIFLMVISGAFFLSSLFSALPMFWDRRGPDGQPLDGRPADGQTNAKQG